MMIHPYNAGIIARLFLVLIALALVSGLKHVSAVAAQSQGKKGKADRERELRNKQLQDKADSTKNQGRSSNAQGRASKGNKGERRRDLDHPQSAGKPQAEATDEMLGLIVWRLRPAGPRERVAAPLLSLNADGSSARWAQERVNATTLFKKGERVRLSIEVPRVKGAYLYVINRGMYADGALGAPSLIFPTKRIRGGDNLVATGQLIYLPGDSDNPPYFEITDPTPTEKLIGERLTIIVTPSPLDLPTLGERPLKLDPQQVEEWEKQWGSKEEVDRIEDSSALGKPRTVAEKRAAEGKRDLTHRDPLPQTIFRVRNKPTANLLIVTQLQVKQ
jgi:hypothetical protein